MSKTEPSTASGLGPEAKMELRQRRPDAHHPFFIKRMSWPWFSAELVRIQPTELEFRVKGDTSYLALHNYVRSDGETTINGGSRSTLTDARDKLTFAPIGSSVEGWNCFKRSVSSAIAVHLIPPASNHDLNDISKIPPSLYFENDNLKATLQKLRSVIDGSGIDDRAYAETLGLLLLWELRHAADPKYSRLEPVRGGLTGRPPLSAPKVCCRAYSLLASKAPAALFSAEISHRPRDCIYHISGQRWQKSSTHTTQPILQ